jgi:hypothetical protein
MEYLAELKFAAAELLTFGHIYFPGLPVPAPDLLALRDGIDPTVRGVSDVARKQLSSAAKWLDLLAVHALVDMMRGGEQDHLSAMWTLGAGLPQQKCLDVYARMILLRENATLRWVFGSVDVNLQFPEGSVDLVTAAARVADASVALCLAELRPWSPTIGADAAAVEQVSAEKEVEVPDLGPLTMEDQIGTSDLLLGSLASFDSKENLTPKFDDVMVEAGAGEVMDDVHAEEVPSETSLAA